MQQTPWEEAPETDCMYDGQHFLFSSRLKSGTSDVDKAEDAGGTHPLPAVSQKRLFSPEAHSLIYKCFPTAEQPHLVLPHAPYLYNILLGEASALWTLSGRQEQKSEGEGLWCLGLRGDQGGRISHTCIPITA